ncbi:MAG: type II toxin-antitoxin system RelE/ParE family toxin [Bacteroidetes bacterium]|nr:type II toxin-antitoxin system RelE/ParE family toxin [Bacteroidota bacterium]
MNTSIGRPAVYPDLGRARPEILKILRSMVSGHYVVFYIPRREAIEVVRVIRKERDISGEMFSGAADE